MGKKRILAAVALGVALLVGFVTPIGDTVPAFAAINVEDQTPAAGAASSEAGAGSEPAAGANAAASGMGQVPAGEGADPAAAGGESASENASDGATGEETSTLPAEAAAETTQPNGEAEALSSDTAGNFLRPAAVSLAIGPMALNDGCSYANPNTGAYSSTLCWIDMAGFTSEWVEVSRETGQTINSTQFNNSTFCPSTTTSGSSNTYRRSEITYRSILGSQYGQVTYAGCARNTNPSTASTNSLNQARNDRNAKLFNSGTATADTGPFYNSVTGWPVEINLSDSYVMRAELSITSPGANRGLAVKANAIPTWSGSFLGNNSFYTGIQGQPALYQAVDGGSTSNDKTSVVSLNKIRVEHRTTGAKVGGYSIVVADAESTDNNESISWSHSGGTGFLWLPNNPSAWSSATNNTNRKTAAVGNACAGTTTNDFPANSNTTAPSATRSCAAGSNQPSPKTGTAMLQISPQSATTTNFSVTQTMLGGGLQAVAFGVVLAGASVQVEVADRVLDANGAATNAEFTASMSAGSWGTFSATTGTTGSSGTSGAQFFPLSNGGGTAQVTFTSASPANPTLSSYRQSWFCQKSNGADPVALQWSGNGGANPPNLTSDSSFLSITGGQFVDCRVRYTPPYLTLVKTVNQAGTAAANVAADFTLTGTTQAAPVSRVQGAGGSAAVIKRPVAIGTYSFTETSPPLTAPNWTHGYTWTGLACTGGNTAMVSTDPTSGAVTTATVAIAALQDVTCTYTNRANQPKMAVKKEVFNAVGSAIAFDDALTSGDVLTYRLTFDNRQGTAPSMIDHVDHLRDVLDDALYLGNIRYGNTFGAAPTQTSLPGMNAIAQNIVGVAPSSPSPQIAITGTVPASQVRTISFQVQVMTNETDALVRQQGTADTRGYLLRNYLTEKSASVPSSCAAAAPGTDSLCTQQRVNAWTVRKDSQPEDGAMIHSNGNIYYRVKVTNYSGKDLTGVKINDDMTETLAASLWDPTAPPVFDVTYGVSFFTASNTRIAGGDIVWNAASGPKPVFTGDQTFDSAFPNGKPFPGGVWKFETPAFTVPAKIGGTDVAYAIVGYAVKGGTVASPTNPATTYQYQGAPVVAIPNATWVNTVSGAPATVNSVLVAPNRCAAPVPTGDVAGYYDCKTWHSVGESYFHIWKKSASEAPSGVPGATVGANLVGSTFVLADTEADARAAVASRWLCRTNNNPNVGAAYVAPGSAPGVSGAADWGESSATAAAIAAWNLANPNSQREECGQFFRLATDNAGQAAGSWRALNVRGGDTDPSGAASLAGWRDNSAFNNGVDGTAGRHGTYWVAETVSPSNHQLLARPFKLWVAPASPTPAGLAPGNPALYDHQGRLSMPIVGEGEAQGSAVGMGNQTGAGALRLACVSPYILPPNNQPNCVMPTGWTMPVFDVKLRPLPLTGGYWFGPFVLGGGVILAFALIGIWWWRQRKMLGAPEPRIEPAGDDV